MYCDEPMRRLLVSNEVVNLGHHWYDHPAFASYQYKEGGAFFEKNIDAFLLSLGYRHNREPHSYIALQENNKRIAVFAHEGVGSIFLSSVLDIPYAIFATHYAMSHTGMTVLHFDSHGDAIVPKILHFSNDSHLYKEGLPTHYYNSIPT